MRKLLKLKNFDLKSFTKYIASNIGKHKNGTDVKNVKAMKEITKSNQKDQNIQGTSVVSVVMPAYNAEKTISDSILSVANQTIGIKRIELIIINDGSTDRTQSIAEQYAKIFSFIKVINKSNGGVSQARNHGLKCATGDYVLFLDCDDTISMNTLKNVVDFFDMHRDKIDVVTYPLYYVRNGKAVCNHWRYKKVLTKTRIYDTNKESVCQTTINICIKRDTIHYFDENLVVQEDQDFNYKSLLRLGKIGYVKDAAYYYNKDSGGISSTKNNPYYMFDDFCSYYERLLNETPRDRNLQSLIIYNVAWRIKTDELLPYYLTGNEYIDAVKRLINIINKVDDDIILNHPSLDKFHVFYLLKLLNKKVTTVVDNKSVSLYLNNKLILQEKSIEIVVNKIKIIDNQLRFIGVLKSNIFHWVDQPILLAACNSEEVSVGLSAQCSESHYKSKMKVGNFYAFYFDLNISDISELKFFVEINNIKYPVRYFFNIFSSIRPQIKRNSFISNGYLFAFENDSFLISKQMQDSKYNCGKVPIEHLHLRSHADNVVTSGNIWLYYDAKNVYIDNGLLQFIHDASVDDGVERYFIWKNEMQDIPDIVPENLRVRFISFGSFLHKVLLLNAAKIITAFIEYDNIYPFSTKEIPYYTDKFQFEVIYLQHGVLHASMLRKYTAEKMLFDKIVVSSYFEIDNFTTKYNVRENDIIKSGMPRLSLIDKNIKPSNRILFAPSWRAHLIDFVDGVWRGNPNKFLSSNYFEKINAMFSSERLNKVLEENDLYIDFKLHPIFSVYKDYFNLDNYSRISIAENNVKNEEYCLFITDFSSFVFDFAYLVRPIIYFVPDMVEFRAGFASYRELDLPFEKGFGNLTETHEECIDEIIKIIENKMVSEKKFKERMEQFFLNIKEPTEDIYQYLTK